MAQTDTNIVVDQGSSWSDLWKKEDYLAIWLGFLIIGVCLVAYFGFGPKEDFTQRKKYLSMLLCEAEIICGVPACNW